MAGEVVRCIWHVTSRAFRQRIFPYHGESEISTSQSTTEFNGVNLAKDGTSPFPQQLARPYHPLQHPDRHMVECDDDSIHPDWEDGHLLLAGKGAVYRSGEDPQRTVGFHDLSLERQCSLLLRFTRPIENVEDFIATMPKGTWSDYIDDGKKLEASERKVAKVDDTGMHDDSIIHDAELLFNGQNDCGEEPCCGVLSEAVGLVSQATVGDKPGDPNPSKSHALCFEEGPTRLLAPKPDWNVPPFQPLSHEQHISQVMKWMAHPSKYKEKTVSGNLVRQLGSVEVCFNPKPRLLGH